MRKPTPSRTLLSLMTAVCLAAPLPVLAAEQELPQTQAEQETLWRALPNIWEDRLERYTAWAELCPELEMAEVVLQVNLDLDRAPYDSPRTVDGPDSLTVLVNKHNALPQDYVPELERLGADYGSGSLRPEAARAFREMADAAREDGISLHSVSAYRSYQHQESTYHRYLTQYRRKTVDTFSARPGHSEHQTGLALDINTARTRDHFENTPAFAWLREHCAQYGFILRYDQGKEAITGYRFEPWHYRYVGTEIAQVCMERGLSYEEYLALGIKAEAPRAPELSETETAQEAPILPDGQEEPIEC